MRELKRIMMIVERSGKKRVLQAFRSAYSMLFSIYVRAENDMISETRMKNDCSLQCMMNKKRENNIASPFMHHAADVE